MHLKKIAKNLIIDQHLYEYKKAPLERFTFLQISSELIFVHHWMVESGSVIKVKPGVTRGALWALLRITLWSDFRVCFPRQNSHLYPAWQLQRYPSLESELGMHIPLFRHGFFVHSFTAVLHRSPIPKNWIVDHCNIFLSTALAAIILVGSLLLFLPVQPTLHEHTALLSFTAQLAPLSQGFGLHGPGAVSHRSPM